eukprot:4337195-Alexandrium_andersonii.AAC.1
MLRRTMLLFFLLLRTVPHPTPMGSPGPSASANASKRPAGRPLRPNCLCQLRWQRKSWRRTSACRAL